MEQDLEFETEGTVEDVEAEIGLLEGTFEELARVLSIARKGERATVGAAAAACSQPEREKTSHLCLHSWCLSSCMHDPLTEHMSISRA